MTLINLTSSVDYNLLSSQKETLYLLVQNANRHGLSEHQINQLDGILNFIDAFQDAIVESHIKAEEEVFPI